MASAVARMFLTSTVKSVGPQVALGGLGAVALGSSLGDTVKILTENPIIPIAIGGVILYIILGKKS